MSGPTKYDLQYNFGPDIKPKRTGMSYAKTGTTKRTKTTPHGQDFHATALTSTQDTSVGPQVSREGSREPI